MSNENGTPSKNTEGRDAALELAENATPQIEEISEETAAVHEASPTTTEESEEMVEVVGVRFKSNGKIYYFAPCGMTLKDGEHVIVDTARGQEYGTVFMPNRNIKSSEIIPPIRNVVRIATEEDTERRKRNEALEIEAYNTFIDRIDAHGMTMKLIDVECAFDNSKLLFYFSAENRIDFRELVKELAGIFHTRIELRQIGIRDEAKMLGGLGICGRPFCCASFLSDFVQVYIKMAKEQNLSLNSSKISGACGRLMCCLRYEYDSYLAEKAITPEPGAEVMTPDGEGRVTDANPLTGIVKVKLAGTSENDAPTVFVREDLVLKENYKGEKLTRTPIPEKRTAVAPASFEVRSPFSETPATDSTTDAEAADTRLQERKRHQNKPQKEHHPRPNAPQKQSQTPDGAARPQQAQTQRADNAQNDERRTPRDNRPQRERGKPHTKGEQLQQRDCHPDENTNTQKKNNDRFKNGKKPKNAAEHGDKRNHPTTGAETAPVAYANDQTPKKPHKPFHHKGNRPHKTDQ